jgi:hypothetical protein
MGNFSRNTFDPSKTYVAVRLQQGVPLVDADWNELQDVTRNEVYDGLGLLLTNALPSSGLICISGIANDFTISPGTAVVGGRPVRVATAIRYTTQRYANAATAAADGVQPVPPLTTPNANRTDTVFLDIFEREVSSSEDPNLINSAIGVETAVRLRREVVLRVAEGTTVAPPPPPGHTFFPIALLQRVAGQANIGPFAFDEQAPRARPVSPHDVAVPPVFQPTASTGFGQWVTSFGINTIVALKAANTSALGVAPLAFPSGARLRTLRVRGQNPAGLGVTVQVRRIRLDTAVAEDLTPPVAVGAGAFDRTFTFDVQFNRNLVDNTFFSYVLQALAPTAADIVEIRGATINYMP